MMAEICEVGDARGHIDLEDVRYSIVRVPRGIVGSDFNMGTFIEFTVGWPANR